MKHFFTIFLLLTFFLSACSTSERTAADAEVGADVAENPGPTPVTEPETRTPLNVEKCFIAFMNFNVKKCLKKF